MIVDEEKVLERLNSPDNLVNKLEVRPMYTNRNGRGNLTPMVQTLAVTLGELDTQKAAGEVFGITQQSVSYLKNDGKNVDRSFVKSKVADVHEKALDAMIDSIELLKPKLKDVKKAVELSAIASNLGRVIEKTSPKEANNQTNVKVVVYAPTQKSEEQYEEVITVS